MEEQKQSTGKKKMSPKKIALIVVAVIVVCALLGIIFGEKDSGESTSSPSTTVSSSTSVSSKASDNQTSEQPAISTEYGWDPAKSSAEKGSTAREDEILLKAIDDAKNISEEDAEVLWEEAFDYLTEHMDNFYESNDIMERSMYYGQFVYKYIEENAAANNKSQLTDSVEAAYDATYNTVKAIKYVYRGAEKVEDESTQTALTKAQENLRKFK